jgi:hypothetical protein
VYQLVDLNERWLSLIDTAKFSELFIEELGWDRPAANKFEYLFGAEKLEIIPVANFKGIQVWECPLIPNAKIQREIDKSISKISAERLIIFHDKKHQNWRWPMSREASGRGVIRLVSHEHVRGQKTLSLLQRLKFIQIPLDEEVPALVEMLLRLRKAFDADQITKSFYREFASYQASLVNSIKGLEDAADKGWYSSLLLNRLMFIYFMQWKGFMDGNQNYLADRLAKIKRLQGPNKFYNFFNDFLLPLFHKGLGAGTKIEIPEDIAAIVGKIPYVNGGIFSEHELEIKYEISISDNAFEEIFGFFDKYQWHLDSRRTGNPNEINPDVLGYVFEQFVNNKDQGAYYTKEDITDYMTSNTLVIRLLERIKEECNINLLLPIVQNGERYIWPSIKHGDNQRDLLQSEFNQEEMSKKSNIQVGLPGESGWETYARLKHLDSLRSALSNGQVESISELISLNIDLELLVSDIIDGLDTAEDVIAIWNILSKLKIVDPTCGSGAFLFAALNQLEHLYAVLLDVAEMHEKSAKNNELTDLLKTVRKHPNRKYFILKHAAQKNIFGVDLMKEATEIARLRLFLKLISAIDSYEDIEPLPDLEFNIKSGNLLVGITKSENLLNYNQTFDGVSFVEDIENQTQLLTNLWENFLISQEIGHEKAMNSKKLLSDGTSILRRTLDKLFYETTTDSKSMNFDQWKLVTSPFHWFIEFPEVFQNGGFDVVIGNPPYIRKNKVAYEISGHFTVNCPDIYAMCMERASLITHKNGIFTMIVMANLVFSERFIKLREFLSKRFSTRYFSGFTRIPAALFEGARVRNVIFVGLNDGEKLYSAPFARWIQDYRPHLMSTIYYRRVSTAVDKSLAWPFITSQNIAERLRTGKGNLKSLTLAKSINFSLEKGIPKWDKTLGKMAPLFYKTNAYNRLSVFKTVPPIEDLDGNPLTTSELDLIWFKSSEFRDLAFTLFLSKWMFSWWAIYGDDFHLTKGNLLSFPVDLETISEEAKNKLLKLAEELNLRMTEVINWKKNAGINVGSWNMSSSTKVLEKIDVIWSEILGTSDLLPELQYQFYSTVKTNTDADNLGEGAEEE